MAPPKILFDGTIEVSYRFIHVDSGVGGWDEHVDHRSAALAGGDGAGCGREADSGISAAAAVRGAADPDPLAAAPRTIEAASWSAPDEDAYFSGIAALVR